jgi:hypothetical protein
VCERGGGGSVCVCVCACVCVCFRMDNPVLLQFSFVGSSCCVVLEVGLRLFQLLLFGRQISFLDNKDVFWTIKTFSMFSIIFGAQIKYRLNYTNC